jgi:hypothetical protein
LNQVGYFNPGSASFAEGSIESIMTTGGNNYKQAMKNIMIIGAGSDGSIKISPEKLDFGTITVGYSKTLSVVITNSSNCNLYIELKMQQVRDTADKSSAQIN